LRHQYPEVFEHYRQKLKTNSVKEQFKLRGRTYMYAYYHEGEFKYWIIQNVLNRAKIVPDPAPQ